MTIKAKHPVREDFSECSKYYETKDHAIGAFESVLAKYGLCFDSMDIPGDDGRTTIDIHDESGDDYVGMAVLMWHRMMLMKESGRWEFTGYIA